MSPLEPTPPGESSSSIPPPGFWGNLEAPALQHMIIEQIPRFRHRPYLAGKEELIASISSLSSTLIGDFCWSLCFTTSFLAELCYEGFLPICCELGGGTGLFVLLPKLHTERCVLRFQDKHISRKARPHPHAPRCAAYAPPRHIFSVHQSSPPQPPLLLNGQLTLRLSRRRSSGRSSTLSP